MKLANRVGHPVVGAIHLRYYVSLKNGAIDLDQIEGTGLGGRVTLKDVRGFIAQSAAVPQPIEETPVPPSGPVG